jgi:hypothetical protein
LFHSCLAFLFLDCDDDAADDDGGDDSVEAPPTAADDDVDAELLVTAISKILKNVRN